MIRVEAKQLTKALGMAGAVIERRNVIPILSAVKMTANGKLRIEGSDLDTTVAAEIDYDGEPFEEIALSEPQRLRTAISAAGGSTASLGPAGEKSFSIVAGPLAATARTLPGDDHPGVHRIGEAKFKATLGEDALGSIRRIMSAVSTEETRYYLNGVCLWKVGDWTWRAAATDGHRLMLVDIPLPDAEGELPDRIIFPRRFVELMLRQFGKTKEGVKLAVGRAMLGNAREPGLAVDAPAGWRISASALVGSIPLTIASKVIDGTYPDVSRVIPGLQKHRAEIARSQILRALQALTPLGEGKVRAIRMIAEKVGEIALAIESVDAGAGRFVVPADHNLPEDFCIGFNGQYLREICEALTGDTVGFGFDDGASPVRISDPADTALLAILMPMRV